MAKLVIYTQHQENYGDESAPHWKNKGGAVYVVGGLSEANVAKIETYGFPNLTKLIESANDYFVEYVVEHKIVGDDVDICEPWERPIVLSYNKAIGRWTALRITENDEYSYMQKEIKRKTETWDMEEEGSYRCSYTVEGYGVIGHANIGAVLNEIALLSKKSVA